MLVHNILIISIHSEIPHHMKKTYEGGGVSKSRHLVQQDDGNGFWFIHDTDYRNVCSNWSFFKFKGNF